MKDFTTSNADYPNCAEQFDEAYLRLEDEKGQEPISASDQSGLNVFERAKKRAQEPAGLETEIELYPETENPVDPNAVAFRVNGVIIGHLIGDRAKKYQPDLIAWRAKEKKPFVRRGTLYKDHSGKRTATIRIKELLDLFDDEDKQRI